MNYQLVHMCESLDKAKHCYDCSIPMAVCIYIYIYTHICIWLFVCIYIL